MEEFRGLNARKELTSFALDAVSGFIVGLHALMNPEIKRTVAIANPIDTFANFLRILTHTL
jgi:hypothetical protein